VSKAQGRNENVFETGELSEEATISKMQTVQHEGNRDEKPVTKCDQSKEVVANSYEWD
jgi:hypothetical protein